jgi:hypothetical protein
MVFNRNESYIPWPVMMWQPVLWTMMVVMVVMLWDCAPEPLLLDDHGGRGDDVLSG